MSIDNKAFFNLSYGLYFITAKDGGKHGGCVANTLIQVTSEPQQLSVVLNKNNFTTSMILKSGKFTATVTSEMTPMNYIAAFGFKSGRDSDKFEGLSYETDERGIRYIKDTMTAVFSLDVVDKVDAGTHIIFIAKVVDAMVLEKLPNMTYSYYHAVKKGSTPPNAPSFQKPAEQEKPAEQIKAVKRWQCDVCGYIEEADELPDDYTCPVCGVDKSHFKLI